MGDGEADSGGPGQDAGEWESREAAGVAGPLEWKTPLSKHL